MIIQVMKCERCGKIIENERDGYSIHGNIYIGFNGGLIGDNFGEDGRLIREVHYCRNCLEIILFEK